MNINPPPNLIAGKLLTRLPPASLHLQHITAAAAMVRYKARYLLFNILYPTSAASPDAQKHIDQLVPSDPAISSSELATLLREELARQFGDWGSGLAGNLSGSLALRPYTPHLLTSKIVKYFSPATSTGIVRVGREQYRLVWAAMTYVKEIRGRPCVLRVVHASGTIKKAELVAVGRAGKDIERVLEEDGLDIEDDDEEMEG